MFRKKKSKKVIEENQEVNPTLSNVSAELEKELSDLKEKLVETQKTNQTIHEENENYQQEIAKLKAELSVTNKNLEAQSNGASSDDSNVILRKMLTEQKRRITELETAYSIVFARNDQVNEINSNKQDSLSIDEESLRKRHEDKISVSIYSTLCKVAQGEPVAASNWAGDNEGNKDGLLEPHLRSLEKLQVIFRNVTKDNADDMAGLMSALQLSKASNELDPNHSLTEVEAIEAIQSVRKHFPIVGTNNGDDNDAITSDSLQIEFSEFVMVSVHCLGQAHRQGESF
mmetsp:Transcript_20778/g.24565  ORF Transcript_20778/g.24565 Transcript_20778/m.24565 type:complete len:286 (+) Transcript_20778:65-922(+)